MLPKNILSIIVFLSISLGFTGCQNHQALIPNPDGKAVVTQYGSDSITIQDILVAFQKSHSYTELASNSPVSATGMIAAITDELAFTREMAKKARELKLDETESFKEYRQNVIKDELYQKLLLEDVLQKITIPEKDIRRYYKDNRETEFKKRNSNVYTIRGIRISTKEHPEKEAKERAEKAYGLLKKGHSFESVAAEWSDADLDKRGKEMPFTPGNANVDVEKRIAGLKDGEFTEPYQIGDAILIHKRERFTPPDYISSEQARISIIEKLLLEERNRRITAETQDLMQKFNCLSNPNLLDTPHPEEKLIILSVAGIYELTVGQFEKLALANNKNTLEQKKSYLSILGPKAVCYAESLKRGWDDKSITRPLRYWEDIQLAKDLAYYKARTDERFSDEKFREAYEKNKENPKLKKVDQYEIYHLFFKAPILLSMSSYDREIKLNQTKLRALQALETVKQGQSFENAITLFVRDDSSGITGGLLGTLPMDKRMADRIGNIGPGEISSEPKLINDPINDRFGYELFYVKKMIPGDTMTLDEMKNSMLFQIAERLYNDEHKKFQEELVKKNPLQFNMDAINQIKDYLIYLRDHPDQQIDIVRYAEISGK